MDASLKLEGLYRRLKITSPAVKSKAEDHVRLLDYRAPTGIAGNGNACRYAVCLHLACKLCASLSAFSKKEVPFNRQAALEAVGVDLSTYRDAFVAVASILEIRPPISIPAIAAQIGVPQCATLAAKVLKKYKARYLEALPEQRRDKTSLEAPSFAAASIALSAEFQKAKYDKNKLIDICDLRPRDFNASYSSIDELIFIPIRRENELKKERKEKGAQDEHFEPKNEDEEPLERRGQKRTEPEPPSEKDNVEMTDVNAEKIIEGEEKEQLDEAEVKPRDPKRARIEAKLEKLQKGNGESGQMMFVNSDIFGSALLPRPNHPNPNSNLGANRTLESAASSLNEVLVHKGQLDLKTIEKDLEEFNDARNEGESKMPENVLKKKRELEFEEWKRKLFEAKEKERQAKREKEAAEKANPSNPTADENAAVNANNSEGSNVPSDAKGTSSPTPNLSATALATPKKDPVTPKKTKQTTLSFFSKKMEAPGE